MPQCRICNMGYVGRPPPTHDLAVCASCRLREHRREEEERQALRQRSDDLVRSTEITRAHLAGQRQLPYAPDLQLRVPRGDLLPPYAALDIAAVAHSSHGDVLSHEVRKTTRERFAEALLREQRKRSIPIQPAESRPIKIEATVVYQRPKPTRYTILAAGGLDLGEDAVHFDGGSDVEGS